MKKIILMSVAGLITFLWAACTEKDEENSQNPVPNFVKEPLNSSTAMALRAHDWRILSIKENGEDLFLQADSCERDDLTRFNGNGTYIWLGNIVKCDSLEPDMEVQGPWEIFVKGQDRYLLLDDEHFKIVQLDQNALRLKRNENGSYIEMELVAN